MRASLGCSCVLGFWLAAASTSAIAQSLNPPPAMSLARTRLELRPGAVDAQWQVKPAEPSAQSARNTFLPLTWKGLIQAEIASRPSGDARDEFRLREAQISVEGPLAPRTSYFVELNFPGPGDDVELNDAFVTWDVARGVRLVAGQLRVPLNRPAVSARTSLFVAEPRASGPQQFKARDRGVNLVLTSSKGRIQYEQALVDGSRVLPGEFGTETDGVLAQGRLIWFATGKWPLPLPAQTDLQNSPWSTFIKAGWASGEYEKSLTRGAPEKVKENTWNIGQAIVGKGLYAYWQYSEATSEAERDFDSRSFSVTSGYAFPFGRYLPAGRGPISALREGWLEPKLQYETLRYDDDTLATRADREIYRYGFNYYPLGTTTVRLMADWEVTRQPRRAEALIVTLQYMF